MITKVKDLGELITSGGDFIDCFVSTDAIEMRELLFNLGFRDPCDKSPFLTAYFEFGSFGIGLKLKKTGLRIDCVDIPMDEAQRRECDIGFIAVSKLRVYVNGNPNISRELVRILRCLDAERQNMAFMNSTYSRTFVKLSPYY